MTIFGQEEGFPTIFDSHSATVCCSNETAAALVACSPCPLAATQCCQCFLLIVKSVVKLKLKRWGIPPLFFPLLFPSPPMSSLPFLIPHFFFLSLPLYPRSRVWGNAVNCRVEFAGSNVVLFAIKSDTWWHQF